MRSRGDRTGGEYDTTYRQQRNRPQVGFEFVPTHRDRGRVDDRREDQQEYDLWREFDVGDRGWEAECHSAEHQQDGCGDLQTDRDEGDDGDDDQEADEELDSVQHAAETIAGGSGEGLNGSAAERV